MRVLFLCAFGAFLALSSVSLSRLRHFILLVLPCTYLIADVAEDIVLALMLTAAVRVTDARIAITHAITSIKIGASALSLLQVVGMALVAPRDD